jgi:CheY-like chemotaxis protein
VPIRVLIAVCDSHVRDLYAEALTRTGCAVQTAASALECVARLKDFAPDLLVLEPALPWGQGEGVLALMREEPGPPPAPVILLRAPAATAADRDRLCRPPVRECHAGWLAPDDLAGRIFGLLHRPVPPGVGRRRVLVDKVYARLTLNDRELLLKLFGFSLGVAGVEAYLDYLANPPVVPANIDTLDAAPLTRLRKRLTFKVGLLALTTPASALHPTAWLKLREAIAAAAGGRADDGFFGDNCCYRSFAGVPSSAGVAAKAPGGVDLRKIGLRNCGSEESHESREWPVETDLGGPGSRGHGVLHCGLAPLQEIQTHARQYVRHGADNPAGREKPVASARLGQGHG